MPDPLHLPSLYRNGAVDPDQWAPDRETVTETGRPDVGDLIAWRYGAWVVHEVRPYLDADLTDEDQHTLDRQVGGLREDQRDLARFKARPFGLVLRHHGGPVVVKPGEEPGFKRLHDGVREIHFTAWPRRCLWFVLHDPYRTCSCHGHIWACQERDQAVLAAHQARKMDRLMATAQPGVCAHCLEPISTRQQVLTFPEESRLFPGAPGPSFHAGRGTCWAAAEDYERGGRLADNPDVVRIASCPGIRFVHERHELRGEQRLDCTAGPFCTGLHGPSGLRRDTPCWYRVTLAANGGAYARPSFDCGYRSGPQACIGGDLSGGGTSLSPTAADLLWQNRNRNTR